MSLWDALSGKVYRWNTMTAEARVATYAGLNSFIRAMPQMSPADHRALSGYRDALFALRWGAMSIPDSILNSDDDFCESVKPRLYSLTSFNYRALLASFGMTIVSSRLLAAANEEDIEKHLAVWAFMAKGTSAMYGRAPDYVDNWISHVAFIREAPDDGSAMMRLAGKLGDEATLILGLRNDPITASILLKYAHHANLRALEIVKHPQFRETVDAELGVF